MVQFGAFRDLWSFGITRQGLEVRGWGSGVEGLGVWGFWGSGFMSLGFAGFVGWRVITWHGVGVWAWGRGWGFTA